MTLAVLSDRMKQENIFHMMGFFFLFFPHLKNVNPIQAARTWKEKTPNLSHVVIFKKKSVATTFFFFLM